MAQKELEMLHKRRVSGSTSFMSSVGEAGLQYGGGIYVCVSVYIYIGFRAQGVYIYIYVYMRI